MEFPNKPQSDKPGGQPRREHEPGSKQEHSGEDRKAKERRDEQHGGGSHSGGSRQADGERRTRSARGVNSERSKVNRRPAPVTS
jgi:hypothetical protein